jgi:hypothetical protein
VMHPTNTVGPLLVAAELRGAIAPAQKEMYPEQEQAILEVVYNHAKSLFW